MHLIVTIDLAGEAFRYGNIGSETARILHNSAERLVTLHAECGALSYEDPEQLYLQDNTGVVVGYVSTVELDDITPRTQNRITQYAEAAAGTTRPPSAPRTHQTVDSSEGAHDDRRKLPDWYPSGVNHIIDLVNDPSPYGEPYPQILDVVNRRLPTGHAKIADIAGGYGRYAMPLAEAGHDVTIVDIDPPHLKAAERNMAKLPDTAGRVTTMLADVTRDEDLQGLPAGSYDASLNLAFLYLAPPETAKSIFHRYARLHRPRGLAVVQFSTNLVRKNPEGKIVKGADEYQYDEAEGRQVLTDMFTEAGFDDLEIESFIIHQEQPLYWHANVLVGSGIKTH